MNKILNKLDNKCTTSYIDYYFTASKARLDDQIK